VSLSEKHIIAQIRRRTGRNRAVMTGIGDDCAILRLARGHDTLVTTDFSIENVHFRRDWHPPRSVGHRCLARGLSDIAAMGGLPQVAFLSLALPRDTPQTWVNAFLSGLLDLAKQFNVTLAGGDTSESPSGILADIMVVGSVPKNRAVTRSGAKIGESIYVTGKLGGSAATLDLLFSNAGRKLSPAKFPRHFFPEPRIAIGRFLREKKIASAMIDLSDGLSTDLSHICEESGVGAQIDASALPLARIGGSKHQVELGFALHGGEDYELLFTTPPRVQVPKSIAGVPITKIGHVTQGEKMRLTSPAAKPVLLKPQGWQHFQRTP
jgi:thiamine-monophosphate kinase